MGHSTSLVEIDGMRLLIDPIWEQRAAPAQWACAKRFFPRRSHSKICRPSMPLSFRTITTITSVRAPFAASPRCLSINMFAGSPRSALRRDPHDFGTAYPVPRMASSAISDQLDLEGPEQASKKLTPYSVNVNQ